MFTPLFWHAMLINRGNGKPFASSEKEGCAR
jgi:hypothetical protein